jgi:dihydroorotate dehydrogenase electron transfer subunit
MTTPGFTPLSVQDRIPFGPASNQRDGHFFALHLERPFDPVAGTPLWHGWMPGQFAMLRPAGWALDLIWARPFSICQVTDRALVFFIQIAGRGTQRMADLRPGDMVHVWGPLGNGFAVEPDSPTLLLAGGIGLAPFLGYADAHPKPHPLRLMFAHRRSSGHYPLDRLNPAVCLEDRPEHSPADREAFLAETAAAIRDTAAGSGLVLACGPAPFLRHVRERALAANARAQISLEHRMGCGVGACLGCVVTPTAANPAAGEHVSPLCACVNGPVFWADQVAM